MREIDLGLILLACGVGMAICFDSVAVTSIGSFMAGMGLGYLARSTQ